jgi:alkaline phosphatase
LTSLNTPLPSRRARLPILGIAAACVLGVAAASVAADDPIRDMQNGYIAQNAAKAPRAYHFGSQGAGDVFSNHSSHSNRLIPVYVFGKKADLRAVTGKNSRYRDPAKIAELYGTVPPNTLNPQAEYADQSDLYRVQKEAVARGVKHIFIVWFDGMDWQTTQAAAVAKTGKMYTEGKGSGLLFQDYGADGGAQFGYYVTSPTHDTSSVDLDRQRVSIPPGSLLGGYDARIAGPNPWTDGPLKAPGYLKGQSASEVDNAGIKAVGGVAHAYTDSSQSAAELVTGVKSYNNSVNVREDGRFAPTLFHQLQSAGWKVGTATSVPFDHVSPAAMYAHNVHRDDYQDLGRDMLGLRGIVQETGKDPLHPGLDVVLGAGFGRNIADENLSDQGSNVAPRQNQYITDVDKRSIAVEQGGKYVVAERKSGVDGAKALLAAGARAARGGNRLFGLYGTKYGHLPYRTADGGYDPANGINGAAEVYAQSDRIENPTLADMTRAALLVLAAKKGQPFALFVESGDVDYGLHDNNVDTAIGAVYSGDEAVKVIIDWVEKNSNWDDSLLIVSADHGHYLVIDDLQALAGKAGKK